MKKNDLPFQNNKNPNHSRLTNTRKLLSQPIPLEVDLENREIVMKDNSLQNFNIQIGSHNIDSFINNFVDPKDSNDVMNCLSQAEKGVEKPIRFSFVHPVNSQKLWFEYRYQIVYVKYAKTRLQGVIVNVRNNKSNPDKTF